MDLKGYGFSFIDLLPNQILCFSYKDIEHSSADLNKHSKMSANNVSSVINSQPPCEQKVVPGTMKNTNENVYF
jgi:hypothetical protein